MRMLNRFFLSLIGIVVGTSVARSQLAITEIMSSAATNLGPALVNQNADHWELSNFGTSPVDLEGYKWNDNAGGLIGSDPTPFIGLTIQPGESIIFFQFTDPGATNADLFRAWWGLPETVRCFPYLGNGLSSTGDGVVLWSPSAADDNDYVDRIDFLEATRGHSFVYDPVTGLIGPTSVSSNGIAGAFKAVTSDDEGSPGTTTGPLPLAISQQPTNLTVNPGDTAVFTVAAAGLPRPKYQWKLNGNDIPGARFNTLTVVNSLTDDVGEYSVTVSNGFETLTSELATLSLSATPQAPEVVTAPVDRRVFVNQTATFIAVASAVPQPTYQWRKDGTSIAGATGNSYTIPAAQLSDNGTYSVAIQNSLGRLTNEATLTVTRRPHLAITEIAPAQSTNGVYRGHNDWWELTNLDDFEVDLRGYRFDDGSAALIAAITFTNETLTISPGESIVFAEGMSAREFRKWWGPGELKETQIVSYSGAGLGLSSLGDGVVLWNSGATEDADTIAAEVFSTATNGVSFGYDADLEIFGDSSEAGVNGAWVAPENGDIGSPGFLRNIPQPRNLGITRTGAGWQFSWIGNPGAHYTLQSTSDLNSGVWSDVTTSTGTTPFFSATAPANGPAPRFFRVKSNPLASQ